MHKYSTSMENVLISDVIMWESECFDEPNLGIQNNNTNKTGQVDSYPNKMPGYIFSS